MTINPQEILERFATEKYPPVLAKPEQMAVREFFAQEGLVSVSGSASFDQSEVSPTNLLLSHDSKMEERLKQPGAVLGPYFLGDEYFPNGLCVWIAQHEESTK